MTRAIDKVRVFVTGVLLVLGGCDQSAGVRQNPGANETPHGRQRSDDPLLEGETCTRTDDCPRAARCVDGHCTPVNRSLRGEVLAERGTRALAQGRFQEGADAFRQAEAAFREREVPVPSSVSCGLARALSGLNDRGGVPPETREQMARALATCLAAAPTGSAMADQAVAGLASLSDRGLDPSALDRPDAALMTGRDPRPTAENTRVRITFTGTAEGGKQLFRDAAQSEPVRQEITRCFLQWWESAHRNSDEQTIRVTYARGVDDYDELAAPHIAVSPADMPALAANADAGTNVHWVQCAAANLQAAMTTLRWPARQERWTDSMVVNVGPN
jgi:hypothetical protein